MIKRFYQIIFLFCFSYNLSGQILFEDDASIAGLTEEVGHVLNGGGVSFVDYDNDGWDDVTLASGNGQNLKFYKNYNGFFVQENLLPIELNYQTKSVNWVDYDNDSDKDLFITSHTNGNKLFQQISDGSFIDVTASAGFVTENMFTFGASWGDINNDGCLDVYISNQIENSTITNYLYRNNCDGTFTEVTDLIGLTNTAALTFCSGFFDFNNDGWQDIYIANDKFHQNFLYKNNGDGTFTDVSISSGTDLVIDAMSVTIDDFNSDGYFDIYITNTPFLQATTVGGSVLLRNNGDETFSNISVPSGSQLDSWSWGANFLDAENDGDLDLYVSCSYDGSNGYASYAFFLNKGNENFENRTNVGFLNNNAESFSSAIGDTNNDGLTDIVVSNNNQEPFLWNNKSISSNNYIKLNLEGTISNADGIGSKIEISVNGIKQYKYVMCGEGYLSQNSLQHIFGIGSNTLIDYIKVKWLSGIEDIIYSVVPNQSITIIEGSNLSIDESSNEYSVFYNNPVHDFLKIKSDQVFDSVSLFSISGQIVYEAKRVYNNELKLPLDFLKNGVYLLKIKFVDSTKFMKIIKN